MARMEEPDDSQFSCFAVSMPLMSSVPEDTEDTLMQSETDEGSSTMTAGMVRKENKKTLRAGKSGQKESHKLNLPKKSIAILQTLTESEKDERRRLQNREAQRRYRERHMHEAYLKMGSNMRRMLLGWSSQSSFRK